MEESDHEMSEEGESDPEAWAGLMPGPDERMEQCKLGGKTLKLPELFLEKKHIFSSVLSMDTWNTALSDEQRKRLETLLPDFPSGSDEKQETLRMLFNWENFKFGNPLQDLQKKLKEGYLHPDIARYRKQTRQFRYRDYKMKQQRHSSDLLKRLLLSRQELFEQATSLAPGDPIRFQYLPAPKKKISPMEQIIKKKSIRILKEVREECGVPDTSSDEDEESSNPVQRSRRQLFKSLGPIPSPEPTIPSVVSTFASKPVPVSTPLVNGDAHSHGAQSSGAAAAKRPRPISPVEVTEDSYKLMLRLHKRKKMLEPELPELDTSLITLQDILSRCQANRKNLKGGSDDLMPTSSASLKKRMKLKAKGEKKRKMKSKELPPPVSMDTDGLLPCLSGSSLDGVSNLQASVSLPQNPLRTVFGPAANFFSLLRDVLQEFPDSKASSKSLEERLAEWMDQNDEISNPWMALLPNWREHITSALNFLSGSEPNLPPLDQFTPLVECCSSNNSRDKAGAYRWIGPPGLDSEADLTQLFRLWLQAKEMAALAASSATDVTAEVAPPGSPPPPKAKTNFIVRPTSSDEKALFREQERSRFSSPHKAFTFMMHGYDSVVGPVKGVYDKDASTNKAREHNLLVSDRPPFVTILTLVRDAAARLPNGEGTRGDICELLKDSQFLAPGVTDAQINAVVSGALDRLHSEKDPCVKYDVTRKLWIYLHRNRTEDEFERIHQAQAASAKVKKTVSKPKASKAAKEPAVSLPSSATTIQPTLASSPLHQPSFTLSSLPSPSVTPSPRPGVTSTQSLPQQLPVVTPRTTTPSDSTLMLTKAGKSATLLRTPSLGVGGSLPPGVTSLTPTIAQLKAAQAAMAKSSPNITASGGKSQTIKQLTSGGSSQASLKKVFLPGQSTVTPGSPLLTVTSLGLSMTSTSASASQAACAISASPSLAAQLMYSPVPSVTPNLTLASGAKLSKPSITLTSSSSSPSLSPLSMPVTTATTFSLVTTLNTAASIGGANVAVKSSNAAVSVPNTPSLRPPTISMLQGQQMIKQQQQLLLKQQKQLKQKQLQQQKLQQQTASQSILRQNAALVAAVGQTVTAAVKLPDSFNPNLASGKSIVSVGAASPATILKPQTFTMAARPTVSSPSLTLPKNNMSATPLKSAASSSVRQTSLILSQDGMASLTSAAGGMVAPPGGKLVALTSVAGQSAPDGTMMAQIMQPAGARQQAQTIRFQGGNIMQPIQISGKQLGSAKGLVQLAGRGGQPLGLIRTPQGPLSTINLIPQAAGGGKTATVVAVGSSSASSVPSSPSPLSASPASTIVTTSSSSRQQQQLAALAAVQGSKSGSIPAGQAKILGQTPAGLLVSQLAPGNIALRAAGGQAKMLQSGQASLVPTQFILQHAPGSVALSQGASAPIIVSSNAACGKGAQNLQVMRTVLSQPGANLKPGQATILISQPTIPQGGAPTTQVLQSGGKASNRGSPKTKGQPVYARIITPPPGLKLAGGPTSAGATGTVTPTPANINMLQTVGGKLALSGLPVVSLAMVNSGVTAVGQTVQAGKVEKTALDSSGDL